MTSADTPAQFAFAGLVDITATTSAVAVAQVAAAAVADTIVEAFTSALTAAQVAVAGAVVTVL